LPIDTVLRPDETVRIPSDLPQTFFRMRRSPPAFLTSAIRRTSGSVTLASNTGATFYITGVQLEVGSSATSFDYRQYGQELALCQRYYQTIDDFYFRVYQVGSSYAGQTVTLPAKMRTSPTVTIVGTWGVSNCGQPTAATNGASTQAVQVYALWTTTGNGKFSADASSQYVSASAEL